MQRTQTLIAALALLAGCLPVTKAYLSLPVANTTGADLTGARLLLPLDQLLPRLSAAQPNSLAFFCGGRTPLRHALQDTDGDGAPDAVAILLDVPAGGTVLTVVAPGEPPVEGPLQGAAGAQVQWERAWR